MKDLLLPNTANQKEEKPHATGLNDTAIPHVKIKTTEIPLEKKVSTAIPEAPMSPSWLFSTYFCQGIELSFLIFNGGISIDNGL